MAQVFHPQIHTTASTVSKSESTLTPAAERDANILPFEEALEGSLSSTTIVISVGLLILVIGLVSYFAISRPANSRTTSVPVAAIAPAKSAVPDVPAKPLTPAELKEVQARDTYAANLSKALHQRMPEYKSVTIFADNWAGTHGPTITAPRDSKTRTGDNLMLVLWSPTRGTARSLGDFTKSRAALEAINAGFAEFQFVDPDSYCFSEVVPVSGPGPLSCGIR
jgi:hypothetical protein